LQTSDALVDYPGCFLR